MVAVPHRTISCRSPLEVGISVAVEQPVSKASSSPQRRLIIRTAIRLRLSTSMAGLGPAPTSAGITPASRTPTRRNLAEDLVVDRLVVREAELAERHLLGLDSVQAKLRV